MDVESIANQSVNAVGSSEKSAKNMPVKTATGKGETVQEDDENFKNGEISSKYGKPIPPYSLCWYVAIVAVGNESKVEKLMNNLDEPIEVWVPGLRKVDKDNTNVIRAYKFGIHSFVFFRFRSFAPDNEFSRQYSGDFQSYKKTQDKVVKRKIFNKILSIQSVQGILKIPGEKEYAPIPSYQIERFRKMVEDGGQPIELVDEIISKGQRVRFKDEYFQGMEGVVESIEDNEPYLYIVLDYLGCAKIKVVKGMIEPFDEEDEKEAHKKGKGKKDAKTVASKREIIDTDWLAIHPYDEMMPVDKQYVAFANSFLSYLDNGTMGVPYDKRKQLALIVAGYVEDKRSRLRLFSSFVAAFRQKKEYIHPVEQLIKPRAKEQLDALMSDYSPSKINAIDLCYILLSHHDFGGLKPEEKLSLGCRLSNVLHNLGCDKLQCNALYADGCRNHFFDGWHGFKKFLLWVVNGRHYLWRQEEKETVATILGEKLTLSNGINPLYFTLTYARKSKVGSDIVTNIEKLKILPSTRYDVLDDDYGDELNKLTKKKRKKRRFLLKRTGTSHTSKVYPVIYDEISTRKYIKGETYICQLANYGESWYLVTPPIIPMHKVLEYRDITAENTELTIV